MARAITTAEELLRAGDIGRCELLHGRIVPMTPAGGEHGALATELAAALHRHVKARRLGRVLTGDPGFLLARDPDTVRAPDVAFVRAGRIRGAVPKGFFPGAPDLAVEIVSPGDRQAEVARKVRDWLRAGCSEVWVVRPKNRTVTVHPRSVVVGIEGTLTGGDLLPGFELAVSDLFAD